MGTKNSKIKIIPYTHVKVFENFYSKMEILEGSVEYDILQSLIKDTKNGMFLLGSMSGSKIAKAKLVNNTVIYKYENNNEEYEVEYRPKKVCLVF